MSSTIEDSAKAEYRAAFERLKANRPIRLPKGSPVTQNKVAREAGKDPSALRKDRYPDLILDIQQYLAYQDQNLKVKKARKDNRHKKKDEKIADYIKQLSNLSSIVAAQNSLIEELVSEIENFKNCKITSINNHSTHKMKS